MKEMKGERPACSWRPQGIQMVGSSTTYWPNSSGLAGRQAQVSCVNCQGDLLDLIDLLCLHVLNVKQISSNQMSWPIYTMCHTVGENEFLPPLPLAMLCAI